MKLLEDLLSSNFLFSRQGTRGEAEVDLEIVCLLPYSQGVQLHTPAAPHCTWSGGGGGQYEHVL